jgi:hypothetical protein
VISVSDSCNGDAASTDFRLSKLAVRRSLKPTVPSAICVEASVTSPATSTSVPTIATATASPLGHRCLTRKATTGISRADTRTATSSGMIMRRSWMMRKIKMAMAAAITISRQDQAPAKRMPAGRFSSTPLGAGVGVTTSTGAAPSSDPVRPARARARIVTPRRRRRNSARVPGLPVDSLTRSV